MSEGKEERDAAKTADKQVKESNRKRVKKEGRNETQTERVNDRYEKRQSRGMKRVIVSAWHHKREIAVGGSVLNKQ